MINKLKRKFTILATISMVILMGVLVLIMNCVNYSSVVSESDTVLDVIATPDTPFADGEVPAIKPKENTEKFIPHGMSPEVPYESRYFSVTVNKDGEIIDKNLSRIISVDDNSAKEYIDKAIKSSSDRGFIDQFRFSKTTENGITEIYFLDCGRKLDAYNSFLLISILVGVFGCIIVFVAFLFASGKIVKPIAESYEKQKRFISDAGHEIKTPLTIINANIDLLEADGAESEELSDIRNQTAVLTKLTNDLVMLSKMEEGDNRIQKVEMPLSDIIFEAASAFHAPALSRRITLNLNIMPNVTMLGSPDSMRQLVSVLIENALKYSPDGGIISVDMYAQKKNIFLSVFNTSVNKIKVSDLPNLFERFYRTDSSRNSETGGHGIGLSIAKAIVDSHGGEIHAQTSTGFDFKINILF